MWHHNPYWFFFNLLGRSIQPTNARKDPRGGAGAAGLCPQGDASTLGVDQGQDAPRVGRSSPRRWRVEAEASGRMVRREKTLQVNFGSSAPSVSLLLAQERLGETSM